MVETIEDVIVRRLTAERIEELKKLLRDTQEQYRYMHASRTKKESFINCDLNLPFCFLYEQEVKEGGGSDTDRTHGHPAKRAVGRDHTVRLISVQ